MSQYNYPPAQPSSRADRASGRELSSWKHEHKVQYLVRLIESLKALLATKK